MTFDLPMPPSVNEMYILRQQAGKKGRSLGYGYRKWRDAAVATLRSDWEAAGEPAFIAPLSVSIAINLDRRSDIDNRIKACLDVLGKAIPQMPDDRYVDDLRIFRDAQITGARITIASTENSFRQIGDVIRPIMTRLASEII